MLDAEIMNINDDINVLQDKVWSLMTPTHTFIFFILRF